MKTPHNFRRQLQHHGDFPDGGERVGPDGWSAAGTLNSGMSAITETAHRTQVDFEPTRWDEVIIVATRADSFSPAPGWRPAVNAYRCVDQFVIFVDLAGVPAESIEVTAEPGRLVVRGLRPAPEPACQRSDLAQLLALEIDHGSFERALDLPQEVDPQRVQTEYRDGLLRIQLPLST
jgi:HSP20 family protein